MQMPPAQGPDKSKSSSGDILIPPAQAQSTNPRGGLESRLDHLADVVMSVGALEDHGAVSAATPSNKRPRTIRSAEASSTSSRGSIKDPEAIAVSFTASDIGKPKLRRRSRLDSLNTLHNNDTATTTMVDDGKRMRSLERSVLPSNKSNDPSSRYSPFRGDHSSADSNASDCTAAGSLAITNSTAKEKSSEATEPGNNSIFRERLQAAQNMHIISQSASPAPQEESGPSPFRPESPIAWDLFPRQITSSTNTLSSAAQLRERQKLDADQAALAQHSRRADHHDIPGTISPKESMLDYDPTEDEAQAPLFSQYQSKDRRYLSSEESPDFATYLANMETSKSQPEDSAWLDSLAAARSTQGSRLSETHDVGGSYACTYPRCTARFTSAAGLQRHRREDHQGMSPRPSIAASTTPFTTNPNIVASPSRVGPHKCQRINPSTGKPCNTIFSRSYDLTRHEDTIHKSRKAKVRCHLCAEEKSFTRNDALTRHMRVVHPDVDWPGRTKRRGDGQVPDPLARSNLEALLNKSHDEYEMQGRQQSISGRVNSDTIPEFPAHLVSMED